MLRGDGILLGRVSVPLVGSLYYFADQTFCGVQQYDQNSVYNHQNVWIVEA